MPGPVHQNDVQINRVHSSALCEEIGERLSYVLGSQSIELPARLLTLIEELATIELREALFEVRRD
jgi:hypothetical protein